MAPVGLGTIGTMPIHHVVLLKFHDGTTEDQVDALARGLRRLPGLIPHIANYQVGPDLGLGEGNWDFAVSADFASEGDFLTYRGHPEHLAVIEEQLQPITADRLSVQFATG